MDNYTTLAKKQKVAFSITQTGDLEETCTRDSKRQEVRETKREGENWERERERGGGEGEGEGQS